MFRNFSTAHEVDNEGLNLKNESEFKYKLTLDGDLPTSADERSTLQIRYLSPHPPNIPISLQNDTLFYEKFHLPVNPENILTLLALIIFTLWIILGNLLIFIAIIRCRMCNLKEKGREMINPLDIYLSNLILMDVFVGLFVMPFMSTVVLIGYSPFGYVLCTIWIFIDYYFIVNSSFGLSILLIHFLWMINWTKSFLELSTKFHIYFIMGSWIFVNFTWLPAFINDHINSESIPGSCGFSIYLNQYYALFLGVTGLYLPLVVVMLPCFLYIIQVLENTRGIRNNRIFFAPELIPSSLTMMAAATISSTTANGHIFNAESSRDSGPGPGTNGRPELPTQFLKRILSQKFIFETTTILNTQESAKKYFPLIGFIFATFLASRVLFYIYFGIGILSENIFPPDLSNGIYWLMHGNAGLSPIIHLLFETELRQECMDILGLKMIRKSSSKSASTSTTSSASSVTKISVLPSGVSPSPSTSTSNIPSSPSPTPTTDINITIYPQNSHNHNHQHNHMVSNGHTFPLRLDPVVDQQDLDFELENHFQIHSNSNGHAAIV